MCWNGFYITTPRRQRTLTQVELVLTGFMLAFSVGLKLLMFSKTKPYVIYYIVTILRS